MNEHIKLVKELEIKQFDYDTVMRIGKSDFWKDLLELIPDNIKIEYEEI